MLSSAWLPICHQSLFTSFSPLSRAKWSYLPQCYLNSFGTASFGREQPNKHVRTNHIIHLFIIHLIVTDNVIQWHIMDTWNGLNGCAHLFLSCHLMYKMGRTIMFHAKVESFVIREVTVQTFSPTYTKSCRWFRFHPVPLGAPLDEIWVLKSPTVWSSFPSMQMSFFRNFLFP